MTSQLKAFKVLVTIKERRGTRLQQTLNQARAETLHGQQLQMLAQEQLLAAQHELASGEERMRQLLDQEFAPGNYITAGLQQVDLEQASRSAGTQLEQAQLHVQELRLAAARALQAVKLNEHRIEQFRDQMNRLKAEAELSDMERTDEDAEEASVARSLRLRRDARQQANQEQSP